MFDQLNGFSPLSWSDELSSVARLYLNEKGSCSQFQNDENLESFKEMVDTLYFDSYESIDLELVTKTYPQVEDLDLTILSLEDTHEFGLACACAGVNDQGEQLYTCLLVAILEPTPKLFGGNPPSPQSDLSLEEVCQSKCEKPDLSQHQAKLLKNIEAKDSARTASSTPDYFTVKASRQSEDEDSQSLLPHTRNLEGGRDLQVSPCAYAPFDPECFTWTDSNGLPVYEYSIPDPCENDDEYWNGTDCNSCYAMYPGCHSCSIDSCGAPIVRTCTNECKWTDSTAAASEQTQLLEFVDGDDDWTCWCEPGEAWVQVNEEEGYCASCDSFPIPPEVCTLGNNCKYPNHHNPSICYGCHAGYGLNMCALTCHNCDEIAETTGCLECEIAEDNGEVIGTCTQCIGEMVLTADGTCEYPECNDYDVYTAGHLRTSAVCNECDDWFGLNIQSCVECHDPNMDRVDDVVWRGCIDCNFTNIDQDIGQGIHADYQLDDCIACQPGWQLAERDPEDVAKGQPPHECLPPIECVNGVDANGFCLCIGGQIANDDGTCDQCDFLIDNGSTGCETCDEDFDGNVLCQECLEPLVLNPITGECEFELCDFYQAWHDVTGGYDYLNTLMVRAECISCEEGFGLRDGRCFTCSGVDVVLSDGSVVNTMDVLEEVVNPFEPVYYWKGCISCSLESEEPYDVHDCISCDGDEVLASNPDYEEDGSKGPPTICVPIVPPYIPNCDEKDVRETYCLDCSEGYYEDPQIQAVWMKLFPLSFLLQSPQCIPCGENCTNCTPTQCIDCLPGYSTTAQDPQNCVPQCDDDPLCEVCDAPGICSQCQDGSYPDETGMCVDCLDPGCAQCDQEDGICHECEDNYNLDELTGECVADCSGIMNNCDECEVPSTCTECEEGYYLNEDGLCSLCSALCETCTLKEECQSCKTEDPYNALLFGDSCINDCSVVQDHCVECIQSPDSHDEVDCTECDYGFYLSDDHSECLDCNDNCEICPSLDICPVCDPGYLEFPEESGNCIPDCTLYLNECTECSTPHNCTECSEETFPPVFLSSEINDCEQCLDPKCLSCDEDECNQCEEGWEVNPEDELDCIVECQFIDPKCEECSVEGVCDQCEDGTFWNGVSCENCDSSCELCDAAGCTECDFPDYLLIDHECVPNCSEIDDECTVCESTSDCTECSIGFYLSNGDRCNECGETCKNCDEDGCTECINPDHVLTTLDNGDVICDYDCSGIGNCEECNSPNSCVQCEDGYIEFLTTGVNDTICIPDCTDGEEWRNPQTYECIACDPSCDQCDPIDGECVECDDDFLSSVGGVIDPGKGYTPSGTVCTPGPCGDGCRVCSFEDNEEGGEQICSQCYEWYELNESTNECEEVICLYPEEFANEATEECEECHENCLGCTGPEDTDCEVCALEDEDGNMAYELTIYEIIDGENVAVDHQCVPDCPDLFEEDDDTQTCIPVEPEGNITITPPPSPVPGPNINCAMALEIVYEEVENLCPQGNSIEIEIKLITDAVFNPVYLTNVIDAANAHAAIFYDGSDEPFVQDFTEVFEWNGVTSHHLQDAWTELISKFEVWETVEAEYEITMTNCHNASRKFIVAPIGVLACGSYTWELIPVPPCDWSRRLNGDVTPPEINLEELRQEQAAKDCHGYSLYYIIAGAALVLGAAVLMKKATKKKEEIQVQSASNSESDDTQSSMEETK